MTGWTGDGHGKGKGSPPEQNAKRVRTQMRRCMNAPDCGHVPAHLQHTVSPEQAVPAAPAAEAYEPGSWAQYEGQIAYVTDRMEVGEDPDFPRGLVEMVLYDQDRKPIITDGHQEVVMTDLQGHRIARKATETAPKSLRGSSQGERMDWDLEGLKTAGPHRVRLYQPEGTILEPEPWKPGAWGKASVHYEGDVHHWQVPKAGDQRPTHMDYLQHHGLWDPNEKRWDADPDKQEWTHFVISPKGEVQSVMEGGWSAEPGSDDFAHDAGRLLANQIGGSYTKNEGYLFSKTAADHKLNWNTGTGKGVVLPDGSVHTWHINGSGAPHHPDYLHGLGALPKGLGLDGGRPNHDMYDRSRDEFWPFSINSRGRYDYSWDTQKNPPPVHPHEVDPRLRQGGDNSWSFGRVASDEPWKVVESDFNPANTFFDDPMAPDRSEDRVTVGHIPSRTVYVGTNDTHHADIINHHKLDAVNPEIPEDWSSDAAVEHSDLYFGMIDDRGGHSSWGPRNPAITKALHAHGLIQQPDGSIHSKPSNDAEWHFAKELTGDDWDGEGYGKGVVLKDGRRFTWNVDEEGAPHHMQKMEDLGFFEKEHKDWERYKKITADFEAEHQPKYLHLAPGRNDDGTSDGTWNFAKVANDDPWHVVKSDFDPKNTFFQGEDWEGMGVPSRDNTQVVVAHHPSKTIYVGPQGSHHADIIDHHEIDHVDAEYPEDHSSGASEDHPALAYGVIDHRGGYSSWGPGHEGVKAALHAHGLLQQPDGGITHGGGDYWHFAANDWTVSDSPVTVEQSENYGDGAQYGHRPFIVNHRAKHILIGAEPGIHHADIIQHANDPDYTSSGHIYVKTTPYGGQVGNSELYQSTQGEDILDAVHKHVGIAKTNIKHKDGDWDFGTLNLNLSKTAKVIEVDHPTESEHQTGGGRPFIHDGEHMYVGQPDAHHWELIEAVPELRGVYGRRPEVPRAPAEWPSHEYGRLHDRGDHIHVDGYGSEITKTDDLAIHFNKRVEGLRSKDDWVFGKTTKIEPTHYNQFTGLPCACAYGKPKHMRRKAGVNWNRFKKKQMSEKFLKREGAPEFVSIMDDHMQHDENDGLANFLIKEHKAGRVYAEQQLDGSGSNVLAHEGGQLHPAHIRRLSTWERARQSPHRRGADLLSPDFTIEHAVDKSSEHERWNRNLLEAKRRKERALEIAHRSKAPVVHSWPDGHTVRALHDPEGGDTDRELELEGQAMNHCIGSDEQNYKSAIRNGEISHAYSLRDKEGIPKATFHFNAGGGLAEIHGYGDHAHELAPHVPKVVDFMEKHHPEGLHPEYKEHSPQELVDHVKNGTYHPFVEEGGDYEGEELEHRDLEVEGARNLEDYQSIHMDGDHYEYLSNDDQDYAHEYYDRYGEPPDVQIGSPHYESIGDDLVKNAELDEHGHPTIKHPYASGHDVILHHLVNSGEMPEVEKSVQENHAYYLNNFKQENPNHKDQPGVIHPDEEVQKHRNVLALIDRYKSPAGVHTIEYPGSPHWNGVPYKDHHNIPAEPFRTAPASIPAPAPPKPIPTPPGQLQMSMGASVGGWRFGNTRTANWEQHRSEGYPEPLQPWTPGTLGKGLTSPEGKAYAWTIDEDHGTDGYPSHLQALQALRGSMSFRDAVKDGWGFHQVYHDGTHETLLHDEGNGHDPRAAMAAHMPSEPRCAGCGAVVNADAEGHYTCDKCKWTGLYSPDRGGWNFAKVANDNEMQPWNPGEHGKGYVDTTGKAHVWRGRPIGDPHHYDIIRRTEGEIKHNKDEAKRTFTVGADGELQQSIWNSSGKVDESLAAEILKQHPYLRAQDTSRDWRFTHTASAEDDDWDGLNEFMKTYQPTIIKGTPGAADRDITRHEGQPDVHEIKPGSRYVTTKDGKWYTAHDHHQRIMEHAGLKQEDIHSLGFRTYDEAHSPHAKFEQLSGPDADKRMEWTFASTRHATQIFEHDFAGGYQDIHNDRRPIIYDAVNDVAHVGPRGASHNEVTRAAEEAGHKVPLTGRSNWNKDPEGHQGWIGPNHEYDDYQSDTDDDDDDGYREYPEGQSSYGTGIGWYTTPPSGNVEQALAAHFKAKPADDNIWHFGKTASIVNPWEKGHHGKFLITPEGQLHHWRTGPWPDGGEYEVEDAYPAHAQAAEALGASIEGNYSAGWIEPNGAAHSYGPHKDEIEDQAAREIPGAHKRGDESWHFGSSDTAGQPGEPYDYADGGYGKGYEMADGSYREWHIEWPSGAPHHDEMMGHDEPMRYYMIHPDGREETTFDAREDMDEGDHGPWHFAKAANPDMHPRSLPQTLPPQMSNRARPRLTPFSPLSPPTLAPLSGACMREELSTFLASQRDSSMPLSSVPNQGDLDPQFPASKAEDGQEDDTDLSAEVTGSVAISDRGEPIGYHVSGHGTPGHTHRGSAHPQLAHRDAAVKGKADNRPSFKEFPMFGSIREETRAVVDGSNLLYHKAESAKLGSPMEASPEDFPQGHHYKPGMKGKGFVRKDTGQLTTWNINGFGWPHHGDVSRAHGIIPGHYLEIDKHGEYDTWGDAQTIHKHVSEQAPELSYASEWRFSSGDPESVSESGTFFASAEEISDGFSIKASEDLPYEKWAPGQKGKGFLAQDDTLHTWPVDDEGAPHHMNVIGTKGYGTKDIARFLEIEHDGTYEAFNPHPEDGVTWNHVIEEHDPRLKGGQTGWNFGRQATMTLPQEQRAWKKLDPSDLPAIHEFPNGYTMREHGGHESINQVGEMMRNCWQHAEAEDLVGGPYIYPRPILKDPKYLSLHDEHGIPRAAMYYDNADKKIYDALGMRNGDVSPDHAHHIAEWAKGQGATFASSVAHNRRDPDRNPDKHPDEWLEHTTNSPWNSRRSSEDIKYVPGQNHKGMFLDDRLIVRPSDANGVPHHDQISSMFCNDMGTNPITIDADGQARGAYSATSLNDERIEKIKAIHPGIKWNPGVDNDWRFGSTPPEVHRVPLDEFTKNDPEFMDNWGKRQTFIHTPHNNKLFIGEPGSHHTDLKQHPAYEEPEYENINVSDDPRDGYRTKAKGGNPTQGWIEGDMPGWNSGPNVSSWDRGEIPEHVMHALREHVDPGLQQETANEWKFGAISDEMSHDSPINVKIAPPNKEHEDDYHGFLKIRRPILYSPDKKTVYVGNHGWHHTGIFKSFDMSEDYGNGTYSFGYVGPNSDNSPTPDNEIGWYTHSKDISDEEKHAVEQALIAHPDIDASTIEPEGWHFAANEDYGNMTLPDVRSGRLFGSHHGEAAPWVPGVEGKGLIHKGKPYLWRAEMNKGDPHHPDVLGVLEPRYNNNGIDKHSDGLFAVRPDGRVEPAFWMHGDTAEFAKHHPGLSEGEGNGDWRFSSDLAGNPEDFDPREEGMHPVVWDGENLTVGHEGLHHIDIHPNPDQAHTGLVTLKANPNNPEYKQGTVSWFGKGTPDNHEAIRTELEKRFETPLTTDREDEWRFAKTAADENQIEEVEDAPVIIEEPEEPVAEAVEEPEPVVEPVPAQDGRVDELENKIGRLASLMEAMQQPSKTPPVRRLIINRDAQGRMASIESEE